MYWGAMIASITVAIVRIPKLCDQVQSLKPNFIREMKEGMAVLRQNKGLFALLLVGTLWWVLSIPFFISCIRQQNPLTVLSKIILRKVKQFNLPPPKKNEGFLHF